MRTILGIDPGSSSVGFGIIGAENQRLYPHKYGTLKVAEKDPAHKLLEVYAWLKNLLAQERIDFAGVEKLYFSKNTKTALEVSQARGVLLLCLLQQKIPFAEITPNEVKVSVSNYGGADKKMVAKMVSLMLSLPAEELGDNTTDALAIAIAAAQINSRKI